MTVVEESLPLHRRMRSALLDRLHGPAARLAGLHELRWRMTSRQALFTGVYDSAEWGSTESGSGTGSELRATVEIREKLSDLLSRHGVTSLLDAPCGDWNWMRHVDLPVSHYYGIDIVPSVIEQNQERFGDERHRFVLADLTRDTLPSTDAILCRDCLVHLSFQDIGSILENFRAAGATWLLLNTYPEIRRNRNQFTGARWRRLNFRLAPFGFPEPVESFPDGGEVDPSHLSLWRLQDLPRLDDRSSSRRPR